MGLEIDTAHMEEAIELSVLVGGDYLSYGEFVCALAKDMGSSSSNLMHAGIGISGEAGELLDALKKHWVYNKPLDLANVEEELGDLFFYMTLLMCQLGITEQQVLDRNARKLEKRYPGIVYSDAAAQARADKEPNPGISLD